MSKEKQIEWLNKLAEDILEQYTSGYSLVDKEQLAIALYNIGCRKQEWISVTERSPTWEDGKVLVFTRYGFSICERTVNSRWQGKYANWITHWMPLPDAPKKEMR